MIIRRQLPVASPIRISALLRGAAAACAPAQFDARAAVAATLLQQFDGRAIALTDSGTAALTLALRMVAGTHGVVAMPGYVCVDLIAAARRAGIMVRLYDVDPLGLSPDLDSLRRVMTEGIDAVVVAHLFGFPADMRSVRAMASEYGIPVIEDAAQGAGGTLHGVHAGAWGDLSVLSFGRGKGVTAGHGGALLALDERWTAPVTLAAEQLPPPRRGGRDVAEAAASWAIGRPSVYAIPASIPSLHLGETIYHDAHEPAAISAAATALLLSALTAADAATTRRQATAALLYNATERAKHVRVCEPVEGGTPGYLRFPIVTDGILQPVARLGIVRGYPRPLNEQPEIAPILQPVRESLTGARELARTLMTLPTHHLVTPRDIAALRVWLRAA